jgi:hypothetical protein
MNHAGLPDATLGQLAEGIGAASYSLGVSVGVSDAAKALLTAAGEAYSRGEDEKAQMFRSFGKELETRAATLRKEYDSTMKAPQSARYAELERREQLSAAQKA